MQNNRVSDKGLVFAVIISMFLWGLGWPSGKVLTAFTSVVNFSVYRYAIVIVALLLLLVFTKTRLVIKPKGIPVVLVSGILLAIYSYFFFMGLKTGAAGAGGVLVTTLNPIVAYALGIALSRKLPGRNESLGLVTGAVAGAVLLKLWSNMDALTNSGNLYFLAAAITWAVMSKFTSRGGSYGPALSFSFWQYIVTLLCLAPLMNVAEAQAAVHITDKLFWLNLFFSSAFVTALATTMYFYTTTRIGAEKASSYIFLVPLAAALSSWLLLGERILPHTIAGGLLGMLAVYLINKKRSPAVAPATEQR